MVLTVRRQPVVSCGELICMHFYESSLIFPHNKGLKDRGRFFCAVLSAEKEIKDDNDNKNEHK